MLSVLGLLLPGMADLYLASGYHQRQIRLIAIARHDGWLQQLGDPSQGFLYAEFRQADPQQAAIMRAHRPWPYSAIRDAGTAGGPDTRTGVP